MKAFFKRVAAALCTGYVIVYYGELVFWATPDRDGMSASGIVITWLMYSVFTYPFLWVVSFFKVRTPWAVFLAGAFYGWFEEGIVVQTMYGTPDGPFPASISFTGLAWHALIDVWIGWYLIRRALAQDRYLPTICVACALGLFYGFWGIWWWNQPPAPTKALLDAGKKDVFFIHFALYAFGTTVPLVIAHWIYNRIQLTEFKPSKAEMGVFGVIVLLYYSLITVPAAPRALWVLPPLMGVTFWALDQNRRTEIRADIGATCFDPIKPLNYLLLFVIPLMAVSIYALALAADARLATNELIYQITTPLGALLWIVSVVMCLRPERFRASHPT